MSYIYTLLPELQTSGDYYKSAMCNRYDTFIRYSQLPPAFIEREIDTESLPKHINTLYTNIYEIIHDRYNLAFDFRDFSQTGYIASMIINEYFRQCMKLDEVLDEVLYIDTNLLLDDYKKLIERNENSEELTFTHSLQTINKNIETASFVIWDKFTMVNSNYDRQKIYNIISARYRRGLGNIYFIKGSKEELGRVFDKETFNAMDLSNLVGCSHEQVVFKEDNKKGKLKW